MSAIMMTQLFRTAKVDTLVINARTLRHFDWLLLATMVALALMGIMFIWSATCWVPSRQMYAGRQLRWLGIGMVAFMAVISFDYLRLGRLAYPAYAAVLVALVLVLFVGVARNYARRWFSVFGLQMQPSEFAKIAVVLALARYLMYRKNCRKLLGLLPPFLIALVPTGLILQQPDLGTTLLFLPTLFVMLYVAGASPRHLGAVAAAGVAASPLLWFFVMSPGQRGRVASFLWPQADLSGTGWHLRQSLAAVASGGLTGRGFPSGSPVLLNRGFAAHTDFIFAVISHEWGFLGALAALLLFFLFFSRGIEIASATREPFGRLMVVGMLTMLAFQTLVNVGMTLGLCPITGLTLPFVSYGGSSLLTCFIMAGFVINVGMRRKPVVAPEDFA